MAIVRKRDSNNNETTINALCKGYFIPNLAILKYFFQGRNTYNKVLSGTVDDDFAQTTKNILELTVE